MRSARGRLVKARVRLRCGSCGHNYPFEACLNNKLANGATSLVVMPTCKKVICAGSLRNMSISCLIRFIEGSVGAAPQQHLELIGPMSRKDAFSQCHFILVSCIALDSDAETASTFKLTTSKWAIELTMNRMFLGVRTHVPTLPIFERAVDYRS